MKVNKDEIKGIGIEAFLSASTTQGIDVIKELGLDKAGDNLEYLPSPTE